MNSLRNLPVLDNVIYPNFVSAPPAAPNITTIDSQIYTADSIQYVNVTAGTEVSFNCTTGDAKPAPTLEWTLGGTNLEGTQTYFVYQPFNSGPIIYNATSTVMFSPSFFGNHNDVLLCNATNEAAPYGITANVTLNVLGKSTMEHNYIAMLYTVAFKYPLACLQWSILRTTELCKFKVIRKYFWALWGALCM